MKNKTSEIRGTGRGVRHDALAGKAGAVITFANQGGREQAALYVSEDGVERVNVRLAGTGQVVSISRCQIILDGRTGHGASVPDTDEAEQGTGDAPVIATGEGVTFKRDGGQALSDALAVVRARRVSKVGRTLHTDTLATRGDTCALAVAVASRDGITARDVDTRALATRDARARNVQRHVATLADEFGRAFRRHWEAQGGKPWDTLKPNPSEDVAGIYRAAFIGAFIRSGVCVSGKRALYQRTANQLGFRALLTWHRAFRAASMLVRSYLWGKGAELCDVSARIQSDGTVRLGDALALPQQVRQWARSLGWDKDNEQPEACDAWESVATVAAVGDVSELGTVGSALNWRTSPVHARAGAIPVARVRRELRHARWCLRAFWMVGDSRKWRAGYMSDSQLLRAVVLASRGYGIAALSPLGLLNGNEAKQGHGARGARACSDALRQAVKRLKARLRDGDKLLTDKPEQCARAFVTCMGARASRADVIDLLPKPARVSVPAIPVRDASQDFATLYGVAD